MSIPVVGKFLSSKSISLILVAHLAAFVAPAKTTGPNLQLWTPVRPEQQMTSQQTESAEARELRPGSPIEQELQGGETRAYVVELSAGQYAEVAVLQKGIDVAVRAFAPDGTKITEVDNDPEDGTDYVLLLAGATGRYRLEVLSGDKGAAAGSFVMKVEELREATERDRKRVSAARVFEAAEKLRQQQNAESLRKSIDKYNEALPLWREVGDKRGEAYTLNQIGLVRSRTGEPKKAIEFYEQSMALWREVGDRLNEANELANIGTAYWRLSDSEKALEYNGRALSLAKAAGYREVEALALNNIGAEYGASGQPQEALKYFGQALPLIGNRKLQAVTLNNMAADCIQLGEYQRAAEYLGRSLPLRRAVGDKRGEAMTLHNIGRVNADLGEPAQALEYYKQALALIREVGDRRAEATALQSLSTVYLSLGDRHAALDYSTRALELSRAVSDRRLEAYELNDLGAIYRDMGEPQKALDQFNQALSVVREVGERFEEVSILNNIGDARLGSGDAAGALEFHERAVALSREGQLRPGEAASLYGLARTLNKRGDLTQARSRIEAALEIVESTRTKVAGAELRISYLASNKELYQFYIDLLMRMHHERPSAGFDAVALQASERARARGLLDMLVEARADIRQGVNPELLAREHSLQQQLSLKAARLTRLLGTSHTAEQEASATKEVESLLSDYRDAESQIRATSPRYAALTQPRPLSAAEMQKELDADSLLLEYSLGEERSYLWAVTPNSIRSFALPPRAEIGSAARRVYDLLVSKSDGLYPKALSSLSRTLLGPVADQLAGKRLIVVADGALRYVPFAALPEPRARAFASKSGGASPPARRPLVASHEIVNLPSATVLASLRAEADARGAAPKKVAVFADPVFTSDDLRVRAGVGVMRAAAHPDGDDAHATTDVATDVVRSASDLGVTSFDRLPVSRREAELIEAAAPKGQSLVALDFGASRAAATSPELSRYQIVHFATHSILDNRHPELSGVVLSLVDERGRQQDGFLRLNDVFNLKLGADLVVLSACRTALGKEIGGEGLVGLTRGFMYAGAPRVVASLWDVSDSATAELMSRFYRNMLGAHLPAAAALRVAQVSMSKERRWAAPYYWAGFVLEGEWK
jgi:CHAT domain-containing protein/Tfp pilus assembly protein PilF